MLRLSLLHDGYRAACIASLGLFSACASAPPPEPETPVVEASNPNASTLVVAESDSGAGDQTRLSPKNNLKMAGGSEPSNTADQRSDCQKLSNTIRTEANKLAAALKSMSTSELSRAAMEIDASSLIVRSVRVSDPQVVDYRDRQAEYFAKFAAQLRKLEKAQAANNVQEAQQVKTAVLQAVKENKDLVMEMATYCQGR